MKRRLEILTVILVILMVIGALVFASKKGTLDSKNNGIFNFTNNDEINVLNKELEISEGIINFNLDIPNTSLEILKSNENKLIIQGNSYGDTYYDVKQEGKNIIVNKHGNEGFSIFNWNNKGGNIKILVPEEVMISCFADMSNGSVNISDILVNEIEIDTSNASINLDNLTVEKDIEIDSSNGSISIEKILARNVYFESSNGRANLKNIKANEITVDTSNGDINAYECYGKEVELDTSNGSVTLENLEDKEFVIDELKISTSNGRENINANYKNKR